MSDDRVLRPQADAGVSKRGRKARLSFTDDEKQRERKRAMDRKAQRVSREKTRSHIAHLEKMVAILCEKNESEATTELMAEVSRLNQEIDRLRKIIETIRSVLRADSFETENQTQQKNSRSNGSRGGSRARDVQNEDMDLSNDSTSAPPPPPALEDCSMERDQSSNITTTAVVLARQEVASSPINSNMDCSSEPSLCFSNSWDTEIVPRTHIPTRARSSQTTPDMTQLWAKVYTSLTPPPPPIRRAAPCRIWQKSNRIYARMFNIKACRSASADEISTGSFIKAVKDGWGTLSPEELGNPALEVLRQIDQHIFPALDRTTRVAMMHKSHMLMKYFLNSDEKNWQHIPVWQRPVPSQSTKQHPIAIDFFAWPCLRDRLVSQHSDYFATSSFSLAYQRHFRFSWPFPFEDAYIHDPETDTYAMAPLFAKYCADLRYWGLEEPFFERFPELLGEIGVAHGYETGAGEKVSDSSPTDSGVGTGSPEDGQGEALAEIQFEIETQMARVAGHPERQENTDSYMMQLLGNLPCI